MKRCRVVRNNLLIIAAAIICYVIALLLPITSFAGININVDYVRNSVVFLYGADAAGNVDPSKPLGTGFIVLVPTASDPRKAYKLLVTARHLVDPQWAGCTIPALSTIFMRVNKKNFDPLKDSTGTADLPLSGTNVASNSWLVSEDDEVDAAIMLLRGSLLDNYDVEGIHVVNFPTREEQKTFNAGDTVVSAGLLPGASGKKRNYPIFKFGNISSIPDEPADAPKCESSQPQQPRLLKLWFVAASLVPGNSGSPIFYVPSGFSGLTGGPNPRPMFLGIQSISFIPWDVAGMTPAQYVYDLIETMKLPDADLRRNVQPEQSKPRN